MSTALTQRRNELKSLVQSLASNDQLRALATRALPPERIVTCVMADWELYAPCLAHPEGRASVIAFFTLATQLGLEPGSARGFLYGVPFRKQGKPIITPIVGYRGYCELARRSQEIRYINAGVFYQDEVQGGLVKATIEPPTLEHTWDPTLDVDRGDDKLAGAYAVAQMTGGGRAQLIMTRAQLLEVRAMSKGRRDDAPWNSHFPAMCRKTVLRRLLSGGLVPLALDVLHALDAEPARESVDVAFVEVPSEAPAPRGGAEAARAALGIPEAPAAPERPLQALHDRLAELTPDAELLIGEILDTCTTPDEVEAAMRAEIEGLERGA